MARVLLTWELGGGSGHIVNLRPFGHGLESAGHKVLAALRDLRKGAKLFNSKARRARERFLTPFLDGTYTVTIPEPCWEHYNEFHNPNHVAYPE